MSSNRLTISFFLQSAFLLSVVTLGLLSPAFGQDDGIYRVPRRYLKPTVTANSFFMPESKAVNENLGLRAYSYNQHTINGLFPIYTWSKLRKDEVSKKSLQLLVSGAGTFSNLYFDGLRIDRDLNFARLSVGMRSIYSAGKAVVFVSVTPFVAQELKSHNLPTFRWAGTILYNYSWDYNFSTRIGLTKTFLYGVPNPYSENNFIPLPVLGVRIGPLDGIHFDMTFPRYYSLHFPMGNKVFGSLFIKNYGSLFNYINQDSSIAMIGKEVVFGRYDQLNGFSMHYRPTQKISLFLQTGFATNRYTFFDETQSFLTDNRTLASFGLKNSVFVSFGVGLRFGKSRSVYNNITMYDVFNLNQQFDPADLNETYPSGEIPERPKENSWLKLKKLQIKDIQDLIDNEL